MKILTGDVGGTHSRFEIFRSEGSGLKSLYSEKYANAHYAGFEALLTQFLGQAEAGEIEAACFAVAGPVKAGTCHLTNLDWVLSEEVLSAGFEFSACYLLNDFAAIPYGVEELAADDLICLQAGKPERQGVRAFVGAGTGLGQAVSLPTAGGLQVLATEAGHADFAPGSARQLALVAQLQSRMGPVSNEALLSGRGLVNLYTGLAALGHGATRAVVDIASDEAPSQITAAARQGDGLAVLTLAYFFEMLGSYLGNVALQTLPRGGLYLAGGIVPKLVDMMKADELLAAYRNKARMRELLDEIPVYIITNEAVARLGAARYVLTHLQR